MPFVRQRNSWINIIPEKYDHLAPGMAIYGAVPRRRPNITYRQGSLAGPPGRGRFYGAGPPGESIFSRMDPIAGSNAAALSEWTFRSPASKQIWGTAKSWLKSDLGLSQGSNPGLWRLLRKGALRQGKFGEVLFAGIGPLFMTGIAMHGYSQGGLGGAVSAVGTQMAFTAGIGAVIGGIKASAGIGSGASATSIQRLMFGGLYGQTTTSAGPLAKQIARSAMGMGGLALPLTVSVLAAAGAMRLGYGALKMGNKRIKRARALEMGSPTVDPFGNASTMRMRSIQAIQRSAINARNGIGMEANLFHS